MTEVRGTRTHARPPFLDRRPEPDALEMTHRVRGEVNAGADLAERWRLLVDGDADTVCKQRMGREQAADAASDDHDAWLRSHDR